MARPGESSFPYVNSPIPDEEAFSRLQYAAGAWDAVASSSGSDIVSSDLQVTANGTSNITVNAGVAIVGGFFYRNTLTQTIPVATNSNGSTARTDTVVVESSQNNNEATLKILTGGASAPTLAQSFTGVWQLPIANLTVLAGQAVVTQARVVDRRLFRGPAALYGPEGVYPQRIRPGQVLCWPSGKVLIRNVTGWVQVFPEPVPVWDAVDPAGTATTMSFAGGFTNRGGGYATCAVAKIGHVVYLRGQVKATTPKGAGSTIFILPADRRPPSGQLIFDPANSARVDIATDGRVITNDNVLDDGTISFDGISFIAA